MLLVLVKVIRLLGFSCRLLRLAVWEVLLGFLVGCRVLGLGGFRVCMGSRIIMVCLFYLLVIMPEVDNQHYIPTNNLSSILVHTAKPNHILFHL